MSYHNLRMIYPYLNLFFILYFNAVNLGFWLFNSFKLKRCVLTPKPEETEESRLLYISATSAARQIRSQELTSTRLVQAYINRIELVNSDLNALVHECFEAALIEAQRIDIYLQEVDKDSEEFLNLSKSQPLLGVPFLSKDNLRTKGLVCICGHPKLINDPPSQKDAEVVHRLREAGAILLCVTTLPKLAMRWETFNSVSGTTNNPYDLRKTPGGSSGGVGALVSSASSIFGLGNDLGGSVRIPAFMCGIFGLKPTAGIVPLDGMVPEVKNKNMQQLWTIGPICRYAEDLDIVFRVLVGNKIADNRLQLNSQVDFKKIRVFCMQELNILVHEPLQEELRESVKSVAKYFENTFEVDVVHINLPIAHHTFELWGAVKFGDDAPDNYRTSIQKLANCLSDTSDETFLGVLWNLLFTVVLGRKEERQFALVNRNKLHQHICNFLGDDGILLFPSFCTTAPYHKQSNFTPFNNSYPTLFNALGLPALACPTGLDPRSGMPVGIQVVGAPYSEGLLIAVGKQLEKAFGGWTPPGGQ